MTVSVVNSGGAFVCVCVCVCLCVCAGMEFLVPKTGFFCKVCNRFFSGSKEAEINHCRTLKHYNNLQVDNKLLAWMISKDSSYCSFLLQGKQQQKKVTRWSLKCF